MKSAYRVLGTGAMPSIVQKLTDVANGRTVRGFYSALTTVKRHGHEALRRLRALAPELVDPAPERSSR